jgi:hypothetical protein
LAANGESHSPLGPDSAFATTTVRVWSPLSAGNPPPTVFSPQNRPSFFSHISLILCESTLSCYDNQTGIRLVDQPHAKATPLHCAAFCGMDDVIKFLILIVNYSQDVNAQGFDKRKHYCMCHHAADMWMLFSCSSSMVWM